MKPINRVNALATEKNYFGSRSQRAICVQSQNMSGSMEEFIKKKKEFIKFYEQASSINITQFPRSTLGYRNEWKSPYLSSPFLPQKYLRR
jgi:hypothetical protein